MVVLENGRFNAVEWSRKLHRGKVLPEVELLFQNNMCMDGVDFEQCNNGLSHLYGQVTSMPTVSKAAFNEGSAASHSTSAQETVTTSMLSGFSEVDDDLAEIGGQAGTIRAREDARFNEVMKQEAHKLWFYGNKATNLRDFDGFATFYNSKTGAKRKQVFDCEGATSNAQTSIYGAVYGDGIYGVVPEGTTAGYQKQNLGKVVKTKTVGGVERNLVVQATKHKWHLGLVFENWLAGGRICNIDVADAAAMTNNQAATSFKNIIHRMVMLKARLDRVSGKKRVMMCAPIVSTLLMRQGLEKSSPALSLQTAATQFGPKANQLFFFDYQICESDQILETEAVL